MAAGSHPNSSPPTVAVRAADGHRAELTLVGDLGAEALRELEERLTDPQLRTAGTWEVDMGGVTYLDLACAYALLRAATRRPEPVRLTVRGARRAVQRTLRHAGLDAVAVIEE